MNLEELWSACILGTGLVCLAAHSESDGRADETARPAEGVERHLLLAPQSGNPRNSEGDLLELDADTWLLVWTAFTEGTGGDHDPASLRSMRFDRKSGTWSEPETIASPRDGMNLMSVTLRRLPDRRIALFYLRKRSLVDCQPMVRFSSDEGGSWSDPVAIVPPDDVGYDVLNNDRVLVTPSGALIVPVARHSGVGMTPKFNPAARLRCYHSTDGGASWTCGSWAPEVPGVVLQEPGLFLAGDGTLHLFARTNAGTQYLARSSDGGRSFEPPRPWTLRSPLSPASIQRLEDGRLLGVWNEPPVSVDAARAPRTPLVAAISEDDGATWGKRHPLFQHEHGWYCYVSIDQSGDTLLFSTCAGDRRTGNGLEALAVIELPLRHLEAPSAHEVPPPQPR